MTTLVDWSALGQVALISACAGIGIGLALVLAELSSLRAQAERAAERADRHGGAAYPWPP